MEYNTHLTDTIRSMARDSGAELIGFADIQAFSDSAYQGNNPSSISDTLKTVILIGIPVPKGAFMPLPKGRAEYTNTPHGRNSNSPDYGIPIGRENWSRKDTLPVLHQVKEVNSGIGMQTKKP